jgi:glutamine cyclotransferase
MTGNAQVARTAFIYLCVLMLGSAAVGCQDTSQAKRYDVVRRFVHDTGAYTQGLLFADGVLYESTGRRGQSQVRRVELETGRVLTATSLPANRFGEGLALLDGKLYQLTWKAHVGYVYDAETLALADSFAYEGEGWGLTTDGTHLVMSDGTATLRFLNPVDFSVVRELTVEDGGSPLRQVNELEYVDGKLYANVYYSDWIVRIDAETGAVEEWLDFAGILPDDERPRDSDGVMNGIAFNPDTGLFYVTGKLWPAMFEVRMLRPEDEVGGS